MLESYIDMKSELSERSGKGNFCILISSAFVSSTSFESVLITVLLAINYIKKE